MEEDIKILEEMKQNCLTKREYVDPKAERKAQALENLIKGYRELKEIAESYIWQSNFDMKFYEENYIPKSKIKAKIEELNDYYKNKVYPTKYQWADIDVTEFYDNQIGLLQELMEDK